MSITAEPQNPPEDSYPEDGTLDLALLVRFFFFAETRMNEKSVFIRPTRRI
jgi:hypothetical protein